VYHTNQTHYFRKRITFSDTVVTIGVIPAGAIVINAGVIVTTAFNAATTNVLDIGTSGDDDGFATDLALGTIGRIVADELATSNDLYSTSEVTLTATYAQTGTAATAGEGFVYVEFIP
jgi:hypothetical protein